MINLLNEYSFPPYSLVLLQREAGDIFVRSLKVYQLRALSFGQTIMLLSSSTIISGKEKAFTPQVNALLSSAELVSAE